MQNVCKLFIPRPLDEDYEEDFIDTDNSNEYSGTKKKDLQI